MKTWNFGVVGAGLIADFHARAIRDIPNARFVACCDSVMPKAQALADKYGAKAYSSYEEMVQSDDIDIVTIATPSGLHMEPTVAAAQAGKHVICEKPVEITLERIDAMIAAHTEGQDPAGRHLPVSVQRPDGRRCGRRSSPDGSARSPTRACTSPGGGPTPTTRTPGTAPRSSTAAGP